MEVTVQPICPDAAAGTSNPQDERYLSEEELATAYSLLEEYEAPTREMLRFVFLSGGIRLRQLNRLTWDDIDQKQMTMTFYDRKGEEAAAARIHVAAN